MKRILGLLISSVMLAVTCLTALPVSAKEEYTEYIVPFYSDQTKQRQVLGISNESMLKDGVVLIPLETACEIAGASIAAEDDDAVIITRNYVSWCCEYEDTDKQYLLVDSNTGEGDYFEAALDNLSGISSKGIFGVWNPFDYSVEYDGFHVAFTIDDFHQTKISCKFHDDKLYVSFYEFLVMMGVDVDLLNHEAINEITEFYTSMVEQYSTEEDYKTAVSEIDKLFSAGTGYEQFFYCTLGTPIDELYKNYYNTDLMCDLGDYYGDVSVEWANLVNAVGNYDGLTKTALAALNLNTDYEDVLINVVTYHGGSESDNISKSIDDSVDVIQRFMYTRDGSTSMVKIDHPDSYLEAAWKMQEKADDFEPILSNADDLDLDFSLSPDVFSMAISGLCGAMKNYAKYREIENLFEEEQHLIINSILSSDATASNTIDEAKNMFISHMLNPMGNVIEMHSNLRNEENSYFNLYNSAAKVQDTMNASSPAAWAAVCGAISDAALSTSDDLIMGVIDYTFFGTMPVSSLVNSGILFCVDGLKNTAYGKEQSQIAELDDYVFIQEVAEDCFKEHSLTSENAYSSFIFGLKATMLAFESTNAASSGEIHGRSFDSNENSERKGYVPEELYGLLDQSITANVDFYNVHLDDCDDLTELIGNNTNISKLDTAPRQDITLEYNTIDYEILFYLFIDNNLIPQYGLSDLGGFEAINWNGSPVVNEIPSGTQGIIGAKIYDYNGDGYKECLVIRQNQYDYIIDCYDHDLNLLDSYTACSFTPGSPGYDISLRISMLNDYILIENSSMSIPSLSNYGTNVAILSLSDGRFDEIIEFGGFRHAMQRESLYLNDESIGDTTLNENDIESMKNKINSALQSLGILFNTLEVGWINDSFGVEIKFTDEPILLFEDAYSDELTYFKDYTNLRDHITTPQGEDFSISSYTGRYGKDNIYVEISPVGDSEVDISVEFLSEEKNILSTISYRGTAEKFMSFEASDHSSRNAYTVEFLEDTVRLTVHRIEYINEFNAWDIPDTDITLTRLSEHTTNRDISSWTNDMIANAINQYLDQRVSYATGYYVLSSEMEENEYGRYVHAHHKNGEPSTPQTNYIVTWDKQDKQEDIAYFAVDSTDSFVRFHITDFDPNYMSFVPKQSDSNWKRLYADELRNYINSNSYIEAAMFSLYDIDKDEVPELFLSEGTNTAASTVVYTCCNEKTVNMGNYGQYGVGVSCTLADNWLISSGGSQGAYHLSYYEKRDDELIKIISFSDNEAMATSDNFEVGYWVNDELVSKEKYYEEMGKYTALENESVETRKYSLNESTINSVLLSSSTQMGTIITENDALNVRQSPSIESAKIGTIDKGSTVTILSEVNGWYEIHFNDGTGYVLSEYVQICE